MNHPVSARFYAWLTEHLEDEGMARQQRALVAGLSGSVLEVGAGSGHLGL